MTGPQRRQIGDHQPRTRLSSPTPTVLPQPAHQPDRRENGRLDHLTRLAITTTPVTPASEPLRSRATP
jgi:hypothetical protein